MGDALKNYIKEAASLILLASLSTSIGLTLIWWILSEKLNVNGEILVLLMATAILLVGAIVAAIWKKWITKPIELIVTAIGHIGPGEDPVPAPEIDSLVVGGQITREVVKRVYGLAGTDVKLENSGQDVLDNANLESVLSLVPAVVVGLDKSGNITYLNSAALKYAAVRSKEPLGMSFVQLFPLSYSGAQHLSQWIEECRKDQITATNSWQRVKLTGSVDGDDIFDMAAYFSKDESHGYEVVLSMINHSERYQADENELSFVSLAVHELRTPITVLRGYIEVFQQELQATLEPELQGFMQKMGVSASQLALFINNILNVARIEDNHIDIQVSEIDWKDFLTKAVDNDFKLRASVHGRKIKLELPDKLPTVGADPVSIYEAISNLIDNAIKYSHDGGEIILRAEKKDGEILTSVKDFGIGIPQSLIGNLFEKFFRSHRSKQSVGGTGLGLYLTKIIVESHSGTITVNSSEGQGSVFSFSLPEYSTVASDNHPKDNDGIERGTHGWIKNHSMYRG